MTKRKINEGFGDLACAAERDHEVQMARSDLYQIAKYAIELHEMLKNVSEAQGIEGWQQSKITKAADYLSSVYHNLEYELMTRQAIDDGPRQYDESTQRRVKRTLRESWKQYKS